MTIFLDVDGCLNPCPFSRGRACTHWKWDVSFTSEEGFPINLSTEMGKALTHVGTPIVWLTTWGKKANTEIGPKIGIIDRPVLAEAPEDFSPYEQRSWAEYDPRWKGTALRKILAEPGDRVVWIDDDLPLHARPWETFDPHKRCLNIQPDTDVGITLEHVLQAISWIKRGVR